MLKRVDARFELSWVEEDMVSWVLWWCARDRIDQIQSKGKLKMRSVCGCERAAYRGSHNGA